MRKCECGGLVPARVATCPNCDVTVRSGKHLRKVLAIVAFAASACGPPILAAYGLPPCPDGGTACFNTPADAGTSDAGTKDGG